MKKKILFIIGSFRGQSFQKSLAEDVKAMIGTRAEVEFLNYKEVPLYNHDLEVTGCDAITRVREQAIKADGIWVFSPEYNGKMPGILKNLFDWLSRSLDPSDSRGASAVHRKKVTLSCAAASPKAERIRKDLSEMLEFIRMDLVCGDGVGVTIPAETWETGKLVLDAEQRKELETQVEDFLKSL